MVEKPRVESACRAEQYSIKCKDADSAIFSRYSRSAAGAGAGTKGGRKRERMGGIEGGCRRRSLGGKRKTETSEKQ